MANKYEVLFIARRFPPSVGGMERFAFDLSESLTAKTPGFKRVTWGGSNKWLPMVVPILFIRGLWVLAVDRAVTIIHIQDALLSPVGWVLHKFSRRPYIVVAHGLDVTFNNSLYQKMIPWFLKRASTVISISDATSQEVKKRGVDSLKTCVIPLGITDDTIGVKMNRKTLSSDIRIGDIDNSKLLLTVGRLVKRKGVEWFVRNVMPELAKDSRVFYLVAGEGTERQSIENAIRETHLSGRVYLLGEVSEGTKSLLYKSSDVFVMPNIVVSGDMEGFGRVAHEAAVAGLPVVASDLEGITEAITNGKNGTLIRSGDNEEYIKQISKLLRNRSERVKAGRLARNYTLENYSWDNIAMMYVKIYKRLGKKKS